MSGEAVRSVGIWIRVSTEDQAKGESPEHHEKRARAYCEAKGWHVAEVYHLEGTSGKTVMGHPEAARMLVDIRRGTISALVFSKLARLARNTKELLEFAEIFRTCSADLVSLQEAIDTSTPAGRLFFTMIAAMAQWEREEIADRVSASVAIRAKLGKSTGGAAPYGYRWVDKKLEPDPEEAPVRVLMHELFAEHGKIKRVARILTERGYRTRKGAAFTDSTIARLLEDPTAKGLHRVNYTRTDDNRKAWVRKPEEEWLYHPVPAIISEELWERCASRQRNTAPGRGAVHLFAGFAYCACGTKMYVWTHSPKYICAGCRNKMPIDDLEEVFRAQLTQFLISPDEVAAHTEAASEAVKSKEGLVASAESELRKIAAESDKLYQLYLAASLTKEDFGRLHRPLAARRSQLEDELPRLQADLAVLRIGIVSREAALSDARDLASRWGAMPFPERRQIVETITDRIVIGKGEVEITLLYSPSRNDGGKATHALSCGVDISGLF
ncbi:recombinase family protein [Phenylobacterium sp.]|jgi:site-specific DNA recombinase|uniref:recombinase family protein n=1 Tax=Phenylobacterium sp. TaxID=1871053 RepID=UPI002E37C5CC|nr:recombinase family protein [Phenylobacterium sp.]HEX3363966.1 recombinase family protein [Phenylobacterium sp.]